MDDKEFDWEEVDQFLKDWENLDKIRDEFIDDIITAAATFFVENNKRDNLVLVDFIELSKKELNLTAMDFFFVLGDLLYHYDNKKTDFFSFELDHFKMEGEYDDSHFRKIEKELPRLNPGDDEKIHEHIEQSIAEAREDWNWKRDYNKNFHQLMKKGITDYLYNIDILPPRAFRELDFFCYQKMDDFQFAFEKLLPEDKEFKKMIEKTKKSLEKMKENKTKK